MPEPVTNKTWKNLGLRAISALTLAAVCFVPFYFGGHSWAILAVVLGVRLIWEWVKMTDPDSGWVAFAIPCASLVAALTYYYTHQAKYIFPIVLAGSVLAFFERRRRAGEARWAFMGVLYLVLPIVAIIALRGSGSGIEEYGFKLLLYLILIVIAADVGAYFGGSYFQGPKLAPKLSPKKTWSGLLSGILLGVVIGGLYGFCLKMGPLMAALIALPIVLISVIGDFIESGVKRRMDVKDAGDIMPGHGGLLDRLDSLILVVLVVMLLRHVWSFQGLI